jgi:hypothetical protein
LVTFENRRLRRLFGPKRKYKGAGENYIIGRFVICIFHYISLR